jgi:AraC-like DNA-binding protein
MVTSARAPVLSRFVRDVHACPSEPDRERAFTCLPDGTTHVVLRWHRDAVSVCVRGPLRRALYKRAPGAPVAVVVQFRPGGAFPFFGAPVAELTDRVVPLDELWSEAGSLRDRMAATGGDAAAMIALLEDALAIRLRTRPFEPPGELAVREAIARIDRGAASSIADLASELHISPRTLRRGFLAAVGVSPKTYARMVRFARARGLAAAGRPWADVARSAGYFDQAHLIADFRDLAGASPTEAPAARDRCP